MLNNLLQMKTVSKRAIQKTAEATDDLIGNKIADSITKVSKTSPQNNSETNEKHIVKNIYLQNKEILMISDLYNDNT